jgi:hypothetical protein
VELKGHKKAEPKGHTNVEQEDHRGYDVDAQVPLGFCVGSLVRHPQWGLGTVKKREGAGEDLRLTVSFQSVGLKKLAVKYAMLEGASG